ncbi:unnamed protein product [Moneuplotes crassus]|uniref:Tubulin delta chain n=1 Tax=Euplotes crassus TaxID=5936 RepID=A0AAD1UTM0_EUPCR|nr:unnamed protein product [Moneuplotes crassus]
MSILNLQIGQCGNQVASKFMHDMTYQWDEYSEFTRSKIVDQYFQVPDKGSPFPNSVLIDMEPKVVDRCIEDSSKYELWNYNSKFSFTKQHGSGNNWAYGYYLFDTEYGDELLEIIRKMIEKIDYLYGFLVFQSLAGGTGSGFGTHLVEAIKIHNPKVNMMNVAIWPYSTGEVILQNYNSILTMSRLIQHSDGVISLYNDEELKLCKIGKKIKNPTYKDINTVISEKLLSVFFPCANTEEKHPALRGFDTNDIISHLGILPQTNMLTMNSYPLCPDDSKQFNALTWAGLLNEVSRSFQNNSRDSSKWAKSFGNIMYMRGEEVYKYNDYSLMEDPNLYREDITTGLKILKDSYSLHGHEKSCTVLSNSSQITYPLEQALRKSVLMFRNKAYVHHYEKCNFTEEDFKESFTVARDALLNYKP